MKPDDVGEEHRHRRVLVGDGVLAVAQSGRDAFGQDVQQQALRLLLLRGQCRRLLGDDQVLEEDAAARLLQEAQREERAEDGGAQDECVDQQAPRSVVGGGRHHEPDGDHRGAERGKDEPGAGDEAVREEQQHRADPVAREHSARGGQPQDDEPVARGEQRGEGVLLVEGLSAARREEEDRADGRHGHRDGRRDVPRDPHVDRDQECGGQPEDG